jgi:hypothetical protein
MNSRLSVVCSYLRLSALRVSAAGVTHGSTGSRHGITHFSCPMFHDRWTMFGRSNVGLYAIAVDVETISIEVRHIPSANRRATSFVDLARGYLARADHRAAVGAPLASEQESFETGMFHPSSRSTLRDIPQSDIGRPNPALHALAARWRVTT